MGHSVPYLPNRYLGSGVISVFVTACLLWSFTHPLLSIDNHDARIYAALALQHLNPDAFTRDPFFMFGSQDSYSLFSYLYAPLIEAFGLTAAGAIILLVGGGLWCAAAILLSYKLLRAMPEGEWIWVMAALAVAALSPNYSPSGPTFYVNEGFATARSLAFPLGLIALAYSLSCRTVIAVCFALAAFLIHPLLGMWPLAVAFLARFQSRIQVTWIVVGVLVLGALMISGVSSFARFDSDWERILRSYTHDVFVAQPAQLRWPDHLFQVGLLFSVAFAVGRQTATGRWYLLIGLVASSGFLVAMWASYFWPSRIVIQAQLWRSMWLAAALVPFALCHILALLIRMLQPPSGTLPWLLLAVLAGVFLLYENVGVLPLAIVLGVTCYVYAHQGVVGHKQASAWLNAIHTSHLLPWFSMGVMLAALPIYWPELALLGGESSRPLPSQTAELTGFFFMGGLGLGFASIAYLLTRYGTHWFYASILVAATTWSAFNWDQRSMRDREWESIAAWGRHDALSERIHPGDIVLWDGRFPLNAWYELRTGHYASTIQAIGMVFSREKTFELLRRAAHIRAAARQEGGKEAGLSPFTFHVPTGKGIALLCSDPMLDWVIVSDHNIPAPDLPSILMPELGLLAYRCAAVGGGGGNIGRHDSGKM